MSDNKREIPEIILTGLNHKTAPVELRECLAFSGEDVGQGLEVLRSHPLIKEALIFSTCNRVEVMVVSEQADAAAHVVKKFISDFKKMPASRFESSLYLYRGDEAVRHIFSVASSLDSLVVGEPQILGQVKDAFRVAVARKSTGVVLHRLLHRTFNVAKRVRSETGIGDNAVSISYAAIELGRKIFGTLEGKTVLLVGAGEMAELAVEHLIRHRVGNIFVANRTFSRGVDLAGRFNGQAIRFEEIPGCLSRADIVISSTGSPDYVIKKDIVKPAMKKRNNRPVFFIDIAVPRDIDPDINRIVNSYVYDIDDLKGVIDENIEERNREAIKGERIVDEAVIRFRQWLESLHVVPTIVDLRNKLNAIAAAEVEKTVGSMPNLNADDGASLKRMTEAIVSKILHDPIMMLKNTGHNRNDPLYINMVRNMFRLDEECPAPEKNM